MMEVDGKKIVSLDQDTITLTVQAIVADAGEITYKWYYTDDAGNEIDCTENNFGEVKDVYQPFDPQPAERVKHERYFTDNGDGSYSLYTGDIPAADVILYEKYSAYTVPATGKITGEYRAAAWNNIPVPNGYVRYRGELTEEEFNKRAFYVKENGSYNIAVTFDPNAVYYIDKVLTTLYPAFSEKCVLPAPADIAFNENGNLLDGSILTLMEKENEEDEDVYASTLTVSIAPDNYEPVVNYEWRKSMTSEADAVNLETEVHTTTAEPALTVNEPGWYSVNVISELNRTQKNKLSVDENNEPKACKVTFAPKPPLVERQDISGSIVGYVNKAPATFTVTASIENPDNIAHELLSDKIHYIWQVAYTDTNETYIDIPADFAGVSGLGTNAITVTEKLKTQVANFRCLVINELNNAKAIFDHSGSYVSDGKLSDFKEEPPYIYDEGSYVFTAVNF
jgi:hypothetical protein